MPNYSPAILALFSGLGGGALGLSEGMRDDREQATRAAEQERVAHESKVRNAMNQLAYTKTLTDDFDETGPTDQQRAAQRSVAQTFAPGGGPSAAAQGEGGTPAKPSYTVPDPFSGGTHTIQPKAKVTPEQLNEEALVAAGIDRPTAHAAARNPTAYAELLKSKTPTAPKLVNWETKETADGSLVQVNPETGENRPVLDKSGKPLRGYHAPNTGQQFQAVSAAATLRGQFDADPVVKNAKAIAESVGGVRAAAKDPSPSGDLSLIYQTMKAYDPASSVREGEFATAQNAASVPERIRNAWNRTVSGERLSPQQRADFVKSVEDQARSQGALVKKVVDRYNAIAQRNALNPMDITFDPFDGYDLAAPSNTVGDHPHVQTIDEMLKAGKSEAEIRAALAGGKP